MICLTHTKDLKSSGLSEDTIKTSGCYCGGYDEINRILSMDLNCGGLVIPYPLLNGFPAYFRVKPDVPPLFDGKPAKYLSPKNCGNRLYVPKEVIPVLKDTKIPLVITEGEKKALAAVQNDIKAIALPGVWCWKDKKGVISDFSYLSWKGRKIYIAFDSDAQSNPNVHEAEKALAKELTRRGAKVEIIRIPPGEGGKKQGLDDFLFTHSPETFWALPTLSETTERPILSLDHFMARSFPPIVSLVGDGVVSAASLISIVGRAKLGKTWFSTQLGLSLAGMSGCFISEKLPIGQHGKILYINAEVSEAIFQKRIGLILAEAKEKGLDTKAALKNFFPVTVRGNLRLDRKPGEQELIKMVEKIKPMVIILDPIGPLHNRDENKQEDMGKLLNFLLSIVESSQAALLVVHHMGKSVEGRDEIHYGRGSSVWGDRVDSNLNLMPYGEQGPAPRLKLSFTLRNGPPLDPLIVSRAQGEFLYHAKPQTDDSVDWLKSLINSDGRGKIPKDEIWERYKESGRGSEYSFRKAIDILKSQGIIKSIREGNNPPKAFLEVVND